MLESKNERTVTGRTRQTVPQPVGRTASRRTEARVSPVTKMQMVKKRGCGEATTGIRCVQVSGVGARGGGSERHMDMDMDVRHCFAHCGPSE